MHSQNYTPDTAAGWSDFAATNFFKSHSPNADKEATLVFDRQQAFHAAQ